MNAGAVLYGGRCRLGGWCPETSLKISSHTGVSIRTRGSRPPFPEKAVEGVQTQGGGKGIARGEDPPHLGVIAGEGGEIPRISPFVDADERSLFLGMEKQGPPPFDRYEADGVDPVGEEDETDFVGGAGSQVGLLLEDQEARRVGKLPQEVSLASHVQICN